jgi:hypothetical protein
VDPWPIPFPPSRREALCTWLTANGINPNDVPQDGDLTIRTVDGTRLIAYEAVVYDENGRRELDERGDRLALKRCTMPLVVEPPDWWEPYEKPTRDDLLAATNRVRQLHIRNANTGDCEHCSKRDYPDYAVPHPCPTIQALDGLHPVGTA